MVNDRQQIKLFEWIDNKNWWLKQEHGSYIKIENDKWVQILVYLLTDWVSFLSGFLDWLVLAELPICCWALSYLTLSI